MITMAHIYLIGAVNMDETYFMVCGSFMNLPSKQNESPTGKSPVKRNSQPTADDEASTESDWPETTSSNTAMTTHFLVTDVLVFALNIKVVAIVVEHTTLIFGSHPHSL